MHHRARVALAWAHPELHKLVAQQRAGVLGMLAQALLRKLLKLATLVGKVIDTHFAPVFGGINLIAASMLAAKLLDRLRRRS
jgi:uncharacterized protein (DUF697 family)